MVGGDKMLYCCETCGKKFTREEDALDCEKTHKEEKARREELTKQKNEKFKELQNDYKTLNEKYLQYIKDYGEYPRIHNGYVNPLERLFEMF